MYPSGSFVFLDLLQDVGVQCQMSKLRASKTLRILYVTTSQVWETNFRYREGRCQETIPLTLGVRKGMKRAFHLQSEECWPGSGRHRHLATRSERQTLGDRR